MFKYFFKNQMASLCGPEIWVTFTRYRVDLRIDEYNDFRAQPRRLPYILTQRQQNDFGPPTTDVRVIRNDEVTPPGIYAQACEQLPRADGRTYYQVVTEGKEWRFDDIMNPEPPEAQILFDTIYLQPAEVGAVPVGSVYPLGITVIEAHYNPPPVDPYLHPTVSRTGAV